MTVKIRPAVPEDVESIALLIRIAGLAHVDISVYDLLFPGSKEYMLEKISQLLLYAEKNRDHYSRFKVAEIDGHVAACMSLFTREIDSIWIWRSTLHDLGFNDLELLAAVWRIRSYLRLNPSVPKNTLAIGNVATFPQFRRVGAMHSLLLEAVEQGKREDYPAMQVACWIGNTAAQKAYEKAGFRVTGEYTHPSWERTFGCPGILRLTQEIKQDSTCKQITNS